MLANLTEQESRVMLETVEGAVQGEAFDLEKSDCAALVSAVSKLSVSVNSSAKTYREYLVHQGVHPKFATLHTFHRFGTVGW